MAKTTLCSVQNQLADIAAEVARLEEIQSQIAELKRQEIDLTSSLRGKKLSVRRRIRENAQALVNTKEETTFDGVPAYIIAEWCDDADNFHRIYSVHHEIPEIVSVKYANIRRPSGRDRSIQKLQNTPAEYLYEHFWPLFDIPPGPPEGA